MLRQLLVFFCLLYADFATGDEFTFSIRHPSSCSKKATYFRHGHSYTYLYNLHTRIGVQEARENPEESLLSCHVTVDVPHKCEMVLKIPKCKVKSSSKSVDRKLSQRLSNELGGFPVYFQHDKGEVIRNEFIIYNDEKPYVINLKKGLISLLQLKFLSQTNTSETLQHDIFGSCNMEISQDEGRKNQVETYRDLSKCKLTHLSRHQTSLLSFIKKMHGHLQSSPIDEVNNPFESKVRCHYKATSSKTMKHAKCHQKHMFTPFALDGQVTADISQTLQLKSKRRLRSQSLERSMESRSRVGLSMDIYAKGEKDYSQNEIHTMLEKLVTDYLSQGKHPNDITALPAESFKEFVKILRHIKKKQIEELKDVIYMCFETDSCFTVLPKGISARQFQALTAKIYLNGLLSCGSDICIEVLAKTIKEGLEDDMESKDIIFNMGLFYQPSLNTAQIIYDHCKNKKDMSSRCWLSLTAMMPHFKSDFTTNQKKVKTFMNEVLGSLSTHIGTKCKKDALLKKSSVDKTLEKDDVLTSLQALSNMGQIKGLYRIGLLSKQLMDCISNKQLDPIISRSAVQALDNTGLLEKRKNHLFNIARSEEWPLATRIAILNALILKEDRGMLKKLVNVYSSTKLENMKTYVKTKIYSIMESADPSLKRIQAILTDIMEGNSYSDLGHNILSKSHFVQLSHYFQFPVASVMAGGNMGMTLIYTPSSNVFQTLIIKSDILVGNKKTELFEFALDTKGMDLVMEIIGTMAKANREKISKDFRNILMDYISKLATGKNHDYPFLNEDVMQNLKKIFGLVNMEKASFPDFHISVKILGKNMGFLSLKSIMKLQTKVDPKKYVLNALMRGIDLFLVRTFKLSEFHQIIPTIGGYSIETEMDMSIAIKGIYKASLNKAKLKTQPREIQLDILSEPSMSYYQEASGTINAPYQLMTGIKNKAMAEGSAYYKGSMNFIRRKPLDFVFGMTRHLGKDLYTFYKSRSQMFYLASGRLKSIIHPTGMMKTLKKCLPESYTMILGREICLSGRYFPYASKWNHLTFPILTSADMKGQVNPIDKKFSTLSCILYHKPHHSNHQVSSGRSMHIAVRGKGLKLKREVDLYLETDNDQNKTGLVVSVRDADLHFAYNSTWQKIFPSSLYKMSFDIYQKKRLLHSIHIMKKTLRYNSTLVKNDDYTAIKKTTYAQLTLANGDLSMTVNLTKNEESPTHITSVLLAKYHCMPVLGIFYALHPIPKLAAKSGHTSTFSLVQDSESSQNSFAESWKGAFKTDMKMPGQRISSMTSFSADLSRADRITDFVWIHGNKTEHFRMVSYVVNNTKPGLSQFDYTMTLTKVGKYELDLEGHFRWKPMALLKFEAEVLYKTHEIKRGKRSLSSLLNGLKNAGYKIEDGLQGAFSKAKTKWLHLWNKDPSSPPSMNFKNKNGERFQQVQRDLPFDSNMLSDMPHNRKSFWYDPKWKIDFSFDSKIKPSMIRTPAGLHIKELDVDWITKASVSKTKDLVICNGTFHKGQILKTDFHIDDTLHKYSLDAELEYAINKHDVFIDHHWKYFDNTDHRKDRSFDARLDLKSHKSFDYELNLVSPNIIVRHDINYTKVAKDNHEVRAHAFVESTDHDFYLFYNESSDLKAGELQTDIRMESTFLDYNVTVDSNRDKRGINLNGTFELDGRLPFLMGKRKFDMQTGTSSNQSPHLMIAYTNENISGTAIEFVLLGKKKMKVIMNIMQPTNESTWNEHELLTCTTELTTLSQIQHTITMSPVLVKQTQGFLKNMSSAMALSVAKMGQALAHSLRANQERKIATMTKLSKSKPSKTLVKEHKDIQNKIHKLSGSIHKSMAYIMEADPRVIMMRNLHLDDAMANSVSAMTKFISSMINDPPFSVRHYTKRYVQPVLKEIAKNRKIVLSGPVPFVLEGLFKRPEPTMPRKLISELVKMRTVGSLSPFRDMAILTATHGIITFDGINYKAMGQVEKRCTHLLSGDFKLGRFIFTYSQDGITITTSDDGIVLGRKGYISSTYTRRRIKQLPYESTDKQLSITVANGEIHVVLLHGLAQLTLNPIYDFYLLEMSKLLNNASLGLFGTNNMESGDDLQLWNERGINSIATFQNSYELSGLPFCKIKSQGKPLPCNTASTSKCVKYFSAHHMAKCFWALDPAPYIAQCQDDECQGRSICSIVQAYLAACQHKDLKPQEPNTLIVKEICQYELGHWHDIVFVQSLHTSVVEDETTFARVKEIMEDFSEKKARIGFITYGGSTMFNQPRAHLINNRLLEILDMVKKVPFQRRHKGSPVANPEKAIMMAAGYPFLPAANKMIFLISSRKELSETDVSPLTKCLKEKGISLKVVMDEN